MRCYNNAYYCNLSPTLKKPSTDAQKGDSTLLRGSLRRHGLKNGKNFQGGRKRKGRG